MKILVIEDSQRLLFSLGQGLKKSGFSVDLVANGTDGWDYARFNDYDVIILDLMLPGMDGLTILQKLREMGKQTHILILSAKDQVEDRVRGLQMGADDYLVKPFAFSELQARINALIRRQYESKNPYYKVNHLIIDAASKQMRTTKDNTLVPLTPGEYAILEALILNRGRVLSKEQLLHKITDSESFAGINTIEVMIHRLRGKLATTSDQEKEEPIIKTRRGYGYIIEK